MKALPLGQAMDIPSPLHAVTLPAEDPGAPAVVVALFAYGDQAKRWGEQNYAGRFKVEPVILQ